MLNFSVARQFCSHVDLDSKVLVVSANVETQSFLLEKCIDAGIKAENIVQTCSVFDIETCLKSNVSNVIIDAKLYGYFASTLLEKYLTTGLLNVVIFHPAKDVQTIRMLTDKRLRHINSSTTAVLLKNILLEVA